MINNPWKIGNLQLPNRLIQGPLAGYSCAPFRALFSQFKPPAFCVTEMVSAMDIINKHARSHAETQKSRYLYRCPQEQILAYQISGSDEHIMARAASYLQNLDADLIDINCGCPKAKIRKKGAGSALLEDPQKLMGIIRKIRESISIPLTIKIRIQGDDKDITLAKSIEEAGADALIVHGRRWTEDYDVPSDLIQIARIKESIGIPVIANGDFSTMASLQKAMEESHCDAYMISRAGSGRPWLYQELLEQRELQLSWDEKTKLFLQHLHGLAFLEGETKAVLQGKSLVRYYFREAEAFDEQKLKQFYALGSLAAIEIFLLKQ